MLLTAVRKEKDDLRKEGKSEERVVIAKNLLLEGLTVAFVSKVTGLSVEEIEKLKNQL